MYIKSPLNYTGGKYKLLPQIISSFPSECNTFVDLFTGGLNVGKKIHKWITLWWKTWHNLWK